MSEVSQHILLTRAEAGALLKYVGGLPGPLSPLSSDWPALAQESDHASLRQKGLFAGDRVAPSWQPALATLLDPRVEAVVTVGNAQVAHAMYCYGAKEIVDLTGFTALNSGGLKLAFPVEHSDLASMVIGGLNLDADLSDPDIELDLDVAALLALAGAVDAIRETELNSLIKRNPVPDVGLDFLDIWGALHRGLCEDDFRWFTAVVRRFLPSDMPLSHDGILRGLARLVDVGWLSIDDGVWNFTDTAAVGLVQFLTPLGFASLSLRCKGPHSIERLSFGVVRSTASLWVLDFEGLDADTSRVRLKSTTAERLAQLVLLALQHARERSPLEKRPATAETPMALAARFCSQCGAKIQSGDKFCCSCGQLVLTAVS